MQAHLSTRILWTVGILYAILAIATASFTGYFLYRAIITVYTSEVLGLVQGAESEGRLLASADGGELVQSFLNDLTKIEWVEYAVYEGSLGTFVSSKLGSGAELVDLLHEAGIGMTGQSPTTVSEYRSGLAGRRLSRDLAAKGIAMVSVQISDHSLFDVARLEPTGSAELHIGVQRSTAVRNLTLQLTLQSLGITLLFAAAYLATWVMIRRAARPLTLLAREVRHIEGAEIAASVGGKGRDELSLLAGTVRSVAMELQVASRKLDESTSSVEVRSQALEYARVHIRAITDLSTDGFLLADREGIVIEVNSQLSRLLGISGQGVAGIACKLSPAAALSPLLAEALDHPLYRPLLTVELANGGVGSGSSLALTSDSDVDKGASTVVGAVVRLTDVSHTFALEKQILATLEEIWSQLHPTAMELVEEGRRGLELIVREWRTRSKGWQTAQKEAAKLLEDDLNQVVSRCAQLMRGLKSGITLSSVRSNLVEWKSSHFHIGQLMSRISIEIERQFSSHDVRFFSRIEEGLPEITGDLERLLDLMIGLIAHSYSITDHGSVVCTAGLRGGALSLGVQDTGGQLRGEERLFLFDPIEYDEISVGLLLVREVGRHYGSIVSATTHAVRGNQYEFLMRLE